MPKLARRDFLAGSLTAATVGLPAGSLAAAEEKPTQRFYELRRYRIADEDSQSLVKSYLEKALRPALERQGVTRVGAWTNLNDESDFSVWALMEFDNVADLTERSVQLAADEDYQKQAAALFGRSAKSPAYQRVESLFLKAFASMPQIETPVSNRGERIFELRTYESHNEDAAWRKVEMFDKGETQLMRDVKLGPVFFGETIIGHNVPNLTYMLAAESMEAHREHWQAFLKHPEWDRMKKIKRYMGTVSKIDNWFLTPTGFSDL